MNDISNGLPVDMLLQGETYGWHAILKNHSILYVHDLCGNEVCYSKEKYSFQWNL